MKDQDYRKRCAMIATRFAVAIHIMLLLACARRDRLATSQMIAESVNTNPVVVRRITGQLARAGLVRVRRGPGGAELTRPPAEITLCDIWSAVNRGHTGPILSVHPAPNTACPVGRDIHTVLTGAFSGVEQAMRQALRDTTLASLLEALPHNAA